MHMMMIHTLYYTYIQFFLTTFMFIIHLCVWYFKVVLLNCNVRTLRICMNIAQSLPAKTLHHAIPGTELARGELAKAEMSLAGGAEGLCG